jgi:hypothetical protein
MVSFEEFYKIQFDLMYVVHVKKLMQAPVIFPAVYNTAISPGSPVNRHSHCNYKAHVESLVNMTNFHVDDGDKASLQNFGLFT